MNTDGQQSALGSAPHTVAPAKATMHLRAAEYPTVQECLRLQAAAPPRSRLGRLFGFDPVPMQARPCYRGALGEIAVAAILRELGPGWFILNSVPLDGDDGGTVDHVVIGPPGVFAIAVHNRSGREVWVGGGVFLVDWQKEQCIATAERQADRVAMLLTEAVGVPIDVAPCVVIVDPRSLTIAHPPRRVALVTPRQLRDWLTSRPPEYAAQTVALLGMYAEERSTWHEGAGEPDGLPPLALFRRLQAEVATARRRRFVWTTSGIIAAWCAFFVGLGGAAVGVAQLFIPG
jgi:hypothetical protein